MLKGKKRFSLNEKNAEAIESKFKDNLRKINEEERESHKNSKRNIIKEKDNNNVYNNLKIVQNDEYKNKNIKEDTKQINAMGGEKEKKDEKEKDRERSYSRAMDRFKKRYKRENNSVEVKNNKKSEKIAEMAKRLENVIGRPNESVDSRYERNNTNEFDEDNEQKNNFEEILESQPVAQNKGKKPKKLQFY